MRRLNSRGVQLCSPSLEAVQMVKKSHGAGTKRVHLFHINVKQTRWRRNRFQLDIFMGFIKGQATGILSVCEHHFAQLGVLASRLTEHFQVNSPT